GSFLSLRLFSCLGFVIAYWILYRVLRKRFHEFASLFGATCAFFLFPIIPAQVAEGRFYGLLFLFCTLALHRYVRLSETEKPASKDLLLNALIHGAMALTHVFGFFYGIAFGVGFLLQDLKKRRVVPSRYLSILAGWLMFIPW